ncbi:trehalose 6-phosphatase [Roseiarcus fermentans]|uniref:Trehalose 6-phosphate phosphatase n=1 Tax=Roseiarcus fermentans TaxID=1473586 RepID=A0A366F6T4_9HYPH|nr:trehalose-phosphatase [Roseiarcus fermentans]RBP09680.1 trehalose 6-phosphatase [Roseiarcus fermentans]
MRTTFAASSAGAAMSGGDAGEADGIGLFLDVDGTLLDLAERPDEVVVPASLIADIAAAEARAGGALALVSGRAIAELDRLFAPLRLKAAGVHGAELRLDPDDETLTSANVEPLPHALWAELNVLLRDFPGTFVENKRYSYAVHYRQSPGAGDALRRRLADLLETLPYPGITMLDAHCAFEVKTRLFDKGRAVAAFLAYEPFRRRTPIFIGDDHTDEAGFAAVAANGGRGYSVGSRRPGAVGAFASPAAVRAWLAAYADGAASA